MWRGSFVVLCSFVMLLFSVALRCRVINTQALLVPENWFNQFF